jgi:hypothetical protein
VVCETGAKAVAQATMTARTRSWQFFILNEFISNNKKT